MNIKTVFGVSVLAAAITACDGGGVTLAPTTSVSNSNNTTVEGGGSTPATNPCASYTVSGQVLQGSYDGSNCTYSNTFVSDTRPLTTDLVINELPNGGIHIFEDSLFVGEDVNANAAAQGVRIPQDGEGPELTLAPGTKLAFFNSEDYIRINRGSRIIADGTRSKPIIMSGVKDLRDNQATESDRGLWGGLVINGNGLTNKCTDADRQPTANNPHNCHVTTEGRPSTYGGINNAESSGVLRYLQVRHAGFEVVDGDELNAITFNGVGSGTTVEYVQTYTSLDDGFEMFGGAVDMKRIVAVNVGDDSIDYSEGWQGDIQFALVVHTSGANRCIEADNTGSSQPDDLQPFTKGRVSNMTCITSNVDTNTGTAPSAKGDSEGSLYREGVYFEEYNSIITSNASGMASNECFEVESTQAIAGINSGISAASGNVYACTEAVKVSASAGLDLRNWLVSNGNAVIDSSASLPATVIKDLSPSNPTAYITAPSMTDANGNPINVTVFDVTRLRDNFAADAAPALGSSGSSSFFEAVDFIGAVKEGDDWVSGWTVGL
ncbi:hypothetical protein [Pseudohongiella spirulinae]|uniref:Putative lipoprotein n=1 Tax=Pseudohongiella spirulinae TaxID=1249552 RepID=A0A0S2KFD6_9GAMM|nr:hypothetical protein [Pseudohongiella spirulinae]ALO47035.1 Putative lipoprotein [Pseudohongiella spirulinae]